jgi:hypothetical protein
MRLAPLFLAFGLALALPAAAQSALALSAAPAVQRPVVTAIAITYIVAGQTKTVHLDPTKVEALFFNDRAVNSILGGFYQAQAAQVVMTQEQAVQSFGARAQAVLAGGTSVVKSANLVQTLWNLPDANGFGPAFVMKDIFCIPSIPPGE